MRILCIAFCLAFSAFAQESEHKPRVFISDSQSWEMAGGFSRTSDTATGSIYAGARPQTAEIVKTFGEKCGDVTVTMKADKADYVVLLEHEGAKGWSRKDNKFAVFKADGDGIGSGSTRTLGNAVKDSCQAILKDWNKAKEGK